MHIEITGRNIDVTPALREYAADKLRKLEKLLDGPLEVHVVLVVEKHRHLAEIQVKSRTAVLAGQEESDDLYGSIREVADKLERQALKHKEKVSNKKHRKGPKFGEAAAAMDAEALAAPASSPGVMAAPRIVRSQRYRVKPMTPEDAALELEANGDDLIVFRDSRSYRMNVIYRLQDGNFGLIDPEF
jgi:putative sigma-54 modulation protein